jgi:hypothetical protein
LHFDLTSKKSDFNSKRASIEFIFTLTRLMPGELTLNKALLLSLLGQLKFDRVKPVRDTCIETIRALKDLVEDTNSIMPQTTVSNRDSESAKRRRSRAERR